MHLRHIRKRGWGSADQLFGPECKLVCDTKQTEGMGNHFEDLLCNLKSKMKGFKVKMPYRKMDKSDSMRMEARSRRAQKLIADTLKVADEPGKKAVTS